VGKLERNCPHQSRPRISQKKGEEGRSTTGSRSPFSMRTMKQVKEGRRGREEKKKGREKTQGAGKGKEV